MGTVTSVGLTVPAFLSVSGSPVTTSGTLAVSFSGTALPIANGGTSATTANAALNALAPSQASQADSVLKSDGTNTSWAGKLATPLNDLWSLLFNLKNQGQLRLNDSTNAFYTGLRAPTTLAANLLYTMPSAYPIFAGNVLASDLSGNLSWQTPSVTDPLLLNNGSAANPTYGFNSSGGIGMYLGGASTLGFSVAGSLHTFMNTSGLFPGADNSYVWGTIGAAPSNIYSHQLASIGGGLIIAYNNANTHYTGFQAPAALGVDLPYTMPGAYPSSNNQALVSSTAGVLSFFAGASGSFTTVDLKTVTVVNGLITSIV